MKTIRMSRAAGQAWLAALRGSQYEQGRELLCTADGKYCCLGVLQKVLDGDVERYDSIDNPKRSMSLPTMAWLDDHNIKFLSAGGEADDAPWLPTLDMVATRANDTGKTFAEIADAIEAAIEYTDSEGPSA